MRITIRAMCLKRDDLDKQILQCRSELSKICPVVLVNSIRAKIQELNATLFNHLNQIKTLKLEHLIGPKISSHATFDSQNTVVTIPANLPLTDSEKSADLTIMSCRLLRFLRATHSSEERLENLVSQLNFNF